MLKAYKYEIFPTVDQAKFFDLGITATSIYYNSVLEFFLTAFNKEDFHYIPRLKTPDDKSDWLLVIKEMAYKLDKKGELYYHKQWMRDLVADTEYHGRLFYKEDGLPKGKWFDVAEACMTYAIDWYRKNQPTNPLANFERGAMQMAREHVKAAVSNLFRLLKEAKTSTPKKNKRVVAETEKKKSKLKGIPKFKSERNKNDSFTFSVNFKFDINYDTNHMVFNSSKWNIGNIKIGKGKSIPSDAIRKSITISKSTTNRFYASILVEDNIIAPASKPIEDANIVGIDIGVGDRYYSDSDGNIVENPKYLRHLMNKLKVKQRKLSKMAKNGSNGYPMKCKDQSKNYQKLQLEINRIHEKITNSRNTFIHTLASNFVKDPNVDGIAMETLSVTDMNIKDDSDMPKYQQKAINRALSDAAIYKFQLTCGYKMNWVGKYCIKIDKYFASSQLCHVCGYKNPLLKNLSVRNWICPNCNTQHDRDFNASHNIKTEGIKLLTSKP